MRSPAVAPSPGRRLRGAPFAPPPRRPLPRHLQIVMAVISLDLGACRSRAQLAAALGVPAAALDVVTLVPAPCKRAGCPLSAVFSNRGWCILCSQSWFPRELDDSGQPKRNRRGYGLYGPQFLRGPGVGHSSSCCCSSPLCEKIGYARGGMFRFPSQRDHCLVAARVLGVSPAVRQQIVDDPRNYQIAVWHFHPNHRFKRGDGSWGLRDLPNYRDVEGKSFPFPPPNASVQRFIDEEVMVVRDDALPPWVCGQVRLQRGAAAPAASLTPPPKEITPVRSRTKRRCPESEEVEALRDQARLLQAKLDSALLQNEEVTARVEVAEAKCLRLTLERDGLKKEVEEMSGYIVELEARKVTLSYDDLKPGGTLADSVADFTFFPDFDCNEAFLDLINYTEACEPGEGLCENMVRYHHVSVRDRLQFQNDQDAMDDGDAGDGLATTLAAASATEERGGKQRKVSWKTEWLVFCFFARCNVSMNRIATLFGVGKTLVNDIVYAWANVLCTTLAKFFPTPSRKQMLRAYPKSVIKKFGHANIFALLDATEVGAEVASMKTVNAIMYSPYKHGSTMKWLAACCPIGAVADSMIGVGHGGSISDPVATAVATILESLPFGTAVEVDKGFLIENECAMLGVMCVRPMKLLKHQTQQSAEETGLTQKVGKTRIVVEQANGQMKKSVNYFDSRIKLLQVGLADRILRAGFLLQNFKLAFIQERKSPANNPRPCKAEIRWYGATDDGLVDVRPMIDLWGLDSEVERWHELRADEVNAHLSDTEISDMVLEEDWPTKMKAEHVASINSSSL